MRSQLVIHKTQFQNMREGFTIYSQYRSHVCTVSREHNNLYARRMLLHYIPRLRTADEAGRP